MIHVHVHKGFLQNMTSSTLSIVQKMNPTRATKRRKLLVMLGKLSPSLCDDSIRILPGAPGWVDVGADLLGIDEGRMLERNMSATPPDKAPAVKLDAEGTDPVPSRGPDFLPLFAATTVDGGGKDASLDRCFVSWACESCTSRLGLPVDD